MSGALNIAIAQLDYKLCDYARNVARIVAAIEAQRDADLIVFSELALCGYYPQDLVEEPDFLSRHDAALAEVLAATRGVHAHVALGAVTRNTGVGKPLHNSLLLIRDGEVVLTYHKQLLPTYNVFDEQRHFAPGENRAAVHEIGGVRVGFLICEDGWNEAVRDYALDPVRTVAEAGAQLLVSINASPSNVGKEAERHAVFAAQAARHALPMLYVNQVGANDQLVFDGASFALDAAGRLVHRLPAFEEAVAAIGFEAAGFSVAGAPCAPMAFEYPSDAAFYYGQIVLGLRDYVEKLGFNGVVVGSSGGIDSALTLALAADALGADRVKAVTMPSMYSSTGSVNDSRTLCANLGVQLFTQPIGNVFEVFESGFARAFKETPRPLARENLQARIRGTMLMAFSNHFGHLVLSTGNKSEMSVGYSTLYGDMNGGLNLIGDLYKTEVYALSRYVNALHGREIVPAAIIDKPPSAELAPGQRDTDSLPPYEVLDEILKLLIEGRRLRPAEYQHAQDFVAALERDDGGALVARVRGMIARAEFKRRQAPPIVRCRPRAFGNGRQMPIAATW